MLPVVSSGQPYLLRTHNDAANLGLMDSMQANAPTVNRPESIRDYLATRNPALAGISQDPGW